MYSGRADGEPRPARSRDLAAIALAGKVADRSAWIGYTDAEMLIGALQCVRPKNYKRRVREAAAYARRLIRKHRPAVVAVAQRLAATGFLDGRAIVRAAFKVSPALRKKKRSRKGELAIRLVHLARFAHENWADVFWGLDAMWSMMLPHLASKPIPPHRSLTTIRTNLYWWIYFESAASFRRSRADYAATMDPICACYPEFIAERDAQLAVSDAAIAEADVLARLV